jgi:hypothetical protein
MHHKLVLTIFALLVRLLARAALLDDLDRISTQEADHRTKPERSRR